MSITFKSLSYSIYFCSKIMYLVKRTFFLWFFTSLFTASLYAQSTDSATVKKDTAGIAREDSLKIKPAADSVRLQAVKKPVFTFKNKLLNADGEPVSFAVRVKRAPSDDIFFYLISGVLLLLAFLKYFYSRYFANLFRVFFNTSLRQSQLTDQLLQAKLPSLFFNLFFVISGGIYVYLLLEHYHLLSGTNKLLLIAFSIALLGLVYFLKFCTLKFTGWITGFQEVTNTYVFVIFLINKIIGIFLVPFILVISFSDAAIVNVSVLISLMSIGIFLLLRFFRSYGLIQNQLKINRFHFFLYIMGIEILPLLLIYKGLMVFLSKNL